jgi:hypothetical protein
MWMTNVDVQPGILGAAMNLKMNWSVKDQMWIVDEIGELSNYSCCHVDKR